MESKAASRSRQRCDAIGYVRRPQVSGKKKAPEGGKQSILGGKPRGQMLEEMVEVTIKEIKALQSVDDLFALTALAAKDGLNHYVGGDDVGLAGGRAYDFIGANVEVLFKEESGEAHGWCAVAKG